MDELKPCPFCGQKAERSPINGSVCCPVRGIGKHTDYLIPDVWQTRPLEDALQNQLNVMSEHSAALAVSNYDLIAENNALQQRVEELEMNIKEAVKEIEEEWIYGVAGADGNRDDVYQSGAGKVLDILRKHGLMED